VYRLPGFNNQEFIDAVRRDDPEAILGLYQIVQRFARSTYRIIDDYQTEDVLHDAFLAALRNIQQGHVKDPRRLFAYVRQVVRYTANDVLAKKITRRSSAPLDELPEILFADPSASPEERVLSGEMSRITADVMKVLTERDREIMIRFYVRGEAPAEIRKALNLTDEQFRRFKSRAKDRVAAVLKSYLENGHLPLRRKISGIVKEHIKKRGPRRRVFPLSEDQVKESLMAQRAA
jgi:RNA polymerase sigma factor (sigma-70 family)